IYLFAGFGIGAAIPADSIDPDYGMIVAVQTMVGDSVLFKVICIAFLITLFANMAAWSFGVNSVARYAAEHGNMPKVFASMISEDDMPNGANLVNAVVASLVLCLQLVPVDAISDGVFWMLFGTSVVFLLLTYIPMFPAFLNLRKNDPDRERIFTFPFKGAMMKVMLAIPCIELILAIVATLVPFSAAEVGEKVPMIIIFIVLMLIGEVVRVVSAKGRETEYKGLTPELAAQRLAEEAEEN
ncbi:amino acid permease, partial [Schaalia hyovaginalis]|uniref:amino acid permease n=2 Tax=Actinomycetota TaxID=201174 RepID=UPI002A819A9F